MHNNQDKKSQPISNQNENEVDSNPSSLKKQNKVLKIIVFFFIALMLIGVGAAGFWYWQIGSQEKKQENKEVDIMVSPTEIVIPTVIEDELPSPTVIQVEEKSDTELLKEAFAQKYNHPVSNAIVTINENTGLLAQGGISFEDEIGGGWFLAAKVDGQWIIVDDGNGTISCEKTDPYDFPLSMVPECVNNDGQVIVRE